MYVVFFVYICPVVIVITPDPGMLATTSEEYVCVGVVRLMK